MVGYQVTGSVIHSKQLEILKQNFGAGKCYLFIFFVVGGAGI